MSKNKYLYISYYTNAEAMATKVVFERENISGRLVPVPRRLSASCGTAWMSEDLDSEKIKRVLIENNIEWENITIL